MSNVHEIQTRAYSLGRSVRQAERNKDVDARIKARGEWFQFLNSLTERQQTQTKAAYATGYEWGAV